MKNESKSYSNLLEQRLFSWTGAPGAGGGYRQIFYIKCAPGRVWILLGNHAAPRAPFLLTVSGRSGGEACTLPQPSHGRPRSAPGLPACRSLRLPAPAQPPHPVLGNLVDAPGTPVKTAPFPTSQQRVLQAVDSGSSPAGARPHPPPSRRCSPRPAADQRAGWLLCL